MARRLTRGLSAVVLALAGTVGCSVAETRADWPLRDFQSFTLRAPADWVVIAGGIDSQAGRLQSPGVAISYDFGLYSDPLKPPSGAWDLQVQAGTIDGLPARWVGYKLPAEGTPPVCLGLHVPQVRPSSMGPIRFTAQACTLDPAQLVLARAIMATLHFADRSKP
jgi:hypothetical protein